MIDPFEKIRKSARKERFVGSFLWLLFCELAITVGFGVEDLRAYRFDQPASSWLSALHYAAGSALLGGVLVGAIVVAIGVYRMRCIQINAELIGKKLCRIGIKGSLILNGIILLLWFVTGLLLV